ncbi:MAG: hypothetical protein PHW53_04075 [Patescibacteria group bacterium]|nr:hypothetical protein [Patescibacteria group bacterium]
MSWKKAIGYGLLMWVIMFAAVSLLMAIGLAEFAYLWIITALIAGAVGFLLAKYVKVKSIGLGLGYAAVWVIIGVILDAVVTRYFNPNILGDWTLWVGYGVFVVGVILGSIAKKSVPPMTPPAM